jgi:hypothetical protein
LKDNVKSLGGVKQRLRAEMSDEKPEIKKSRDT